MMPRTAFGSEIKLRGDLEVLVYSVKTGKRVRRYAIRNTITFNGMGGVIELWAQDGISAADFQIASLKVGSGSVAPTRADTGLNALVASKALTPANRVKSLPTGELVITVSFTNADAPGATFREVGLFYGNGSLLARQVHPELPISGFTAKYIWRLGVTA